MTTPDEHVRSPSLGRENQVIQSSSSLKRKRQDSSGEIKTTTTKQEKRFKTPYLAVTQTGRLTVIPDELIFEILSRLPAEFLWKVARCVCKDWSQMILEPSLINSNALLPSLLIDCLERPEFKVACLPINPLSFHKFEFTQPKLGKTDQVRSTSGGVLLIQHCDSLYAVNPLTTQVVKLPSPTEEQNIRLAHEYSYIARVPNTGEFKVLCFSQSLPGPRSCFVLTIGTDMKWSKCFDVPPGWLWRRQRSISIGGVIYLYSCECLRRHGIILAIDLRNHKLQRYRLDISAHGIPASLISCGTDRLGVVEIYNEGVNIWMLEDLYRNTWDIVKSIRFSDSPSDWRFSCHDNFHIWLDSSEMLLISRLDSNSPVRSVLAYFAKKGEWLKVYTGPATKHEFFVHSNSLVRI